MAIIRGRSWFAVLFSLVVAMPAALDARDAVPQFTRVRGVGDSVNRLIDGAYAKSETFRALVAEIQQSNAIVIVQRGLCRNGRFRSCVIHVDGNPVSRHIRIFVDLREDEKHLMAMIAHELFHATELIRDPSVVDAAGVLRIYRGLARGYCGQGLSDICETDGAQQAEAKVLDELKRSSKH